MEAACGPTTSTYLRMNTTRCNAASLALFDNLLILAFDQYSVFFHGFLDSRYTGLVSLVRAGSEVL